MNATALTYGLEYNYDPSKDHQLDHIWDPASGTNTTFTYNTSGSVTRINDPSQAIPQDFFWNEQQQLTGVKNQQGVHHYIYDHQGERLMKSSLINTSVYLNDQVIDDVSNLEPYTVYVNPYYVVTGLMGGDRVSKHYYMNQQRVATDITINYDPNGGGGGEYAPSKGLDDLKEVVQELSHEPLDTSVLTLPSLTDYYPETATAKSSSSQAEGAGSSGRILFWYHADYLGNVDLVTEIDGFAHEFFIYNPWGEEMHQWNANTYAFTSPYRFNSKELDPETGLAYYGARYYQSKRGVWLSVDPQAHDRIWLTPYQFVQNNPLLRIDPNGKLDWKPGLDETGSPTYTAETGDNANTLADQYNISISQANQIIGNTPVVPGQTVINGDKVKKVTGSSILRLDLMSSNTTEQQIIDQFIFAVDYSKSKGQSGFYSTAYFYNTQYKSLVTASGAIKVNDEYLELEIQLPLYRSATFDGTSSATFLGNSANNIRLTTGNRFPKTSIIEFDLFHPNTKNRYFNYQILSPSSSSYKLYDRLK